MLLKAFIEWWNRLAMKNGKVKFRNQREAADFIRKLEKDSGGPNAKVIKMRQQYEAIQRSGGGAPPAEPQQRKTG